MGPILVFDSGLGGLTVAREIRKAIPAGEIVFVADDAGFPYGERDEGDLTDRVVGTVAALVERLRPAAIIVACHTASTLVLPPLRARFDVPIVGTVPAIKPAAEQTKSGVIAVLATDGTIRRDYTRALIHEFAADIHVRLVGCHNLARYVEASLRGDAVADEAILAEIAPAFHEVNGKRTDHVVLACTHYPLILDRLEQIAPWPVNWIDPAPAIARRAVAVLEGAASGEGRGMALQTSGAAWPAPIVAVLRDIGLEPASRVV